MPDTPSTAEPKQGVLVLPPTPTSPGSSSVFGGKQRTMNLSRTSADSRPSVLPWLQDKIQSPQQQKHPHHQQQHQQRLRLPKRRDTPSERRSSSSATVFEGVSIDGSSPLAFPLTGGFVDTQERETYPFLPIPESEPKPATHVRGTRSMSMARGHIALSASSRTSLTHRLSQSSHSVVVGNRSRNSTSTSVSTSPTLPIAARPRFHSTAWSTRSFVSHHRNTDSFCLDAYDENSAELTIRLSVDASQSRSYRMLLEGDSVLADLRVLEDEYQRAVSAVQANFGQKLIGLYFAATWSADCDDFTPALQALSAANRDDLVVVHVSADNHPADMARLVTGSGWLSVPWSERKLRQDLIERMGVSISELPKLVIIDGSTHHIISASARRDVERRPLTCVREWKRSRAGLSWWNKTKPW
ncbi:hypothetical protein H4R99_008337 [Coemansia sp. RSA 1722]|nr:hypothetical protein H4R99_008337 [Coemansia sp. RSA 1722]